MSSRHDDLATRGSDTFRPSTAQPVAQHNRGGRRLALDLINRQLESPSQFGRVIVKSLLEFLDVDDLRVAGSKVLNFRFQDRAGDHRDSWAVWDLRFVA